MNKRDAFWTMFIIVALSFALMGSSLALASTAGQQGDPLVARSYLQEEADRRLGPVQQEIEKAQKRLDALQKRYDSIKR